MAKISEAKLRAQKKYDEAHKGDTKSYHLKFNRETDADVIAYLDGCKNKNDTVREALRAQMRSGS